MSEQQHNDEMLLIDYALRQLSGPETQSVRKRLAEDSDFARRNGNLQNAFAAMQTLGQVAPPDDLMEKTLARIRSAKQTEAFLTQQELGRRIAWPTFSLREAAAVAAAILMMASVFLPAARHSRARTLANECSANVGQIGSAMRTYANDHHFNLPACANHNPRWLASPTQAGVSNSSNLFRLVQVGYSSPVAFQCPAVGGGSFVVQPGMTDFPDNRFVGYSYQHAMGDGGLRLDNSALADVAENMAILADSTPVFANGQFRREHVRDLASENHGRDGQNVLYLDMHVDWRKTANAGVNGNNIYLAEGIFDYKGDETPASPTDSFLLPNGSTLAAGH